MEHHVDPAVIFEEKRHLDADGRRFAKGVGVFGVVLLAASVLLSLLFEDGMASLMRHYLVSWSVWLSLALGGLFFVLIQHLTSAAWSVVVRRIAEIIAGTLPVVAVLFLPILAPVLTGSSAIYAWNDPERVAASALLPGKTAYLNSAFFAIRWVIYFALWIGMARWFLNRSVAQDESGDPALSALMKRRSAPAIVVYAITVTFAAFDLLMSVDAEWFSTIFGVYFFGGACVGFVSLLVVVLLTLQRAGYLRGAINVEHYHDIGKLLFAFVFFWGYIAFSQFMLIWYANIPEETLWFEHRAHGAWLGVSILLIFGHLLVPFAGLLSRHAKRNPKVLAFWAVVLFVMHWVDIHWVVMPAFGADSAFHVLDLVTFVGLGCVCTWAAIRVADQRSLVPERDPRLGDSLAFKNI